MTAEFGDSVTLRDPGAESDSVVLRDSKAAPDAVILRESKVAPDSVALRDSNVLTQAIPFPDSHVSSVNHERRWPVFSAALLSAFVLSLAFCTFTQLGFDWGYFAVQAMFGQLPGESSNQGMTAIWAAPTIVFPLMFGMMLAFCRATIPGAYPWRSALALIVACETAVFMSDFDTGRLSHIANLGKTIPFVAFSLLWGFVCFEGARHKLQSLLRKDADIIRIDDLRRAASSSLVYLVPSLVYGLLAACNFSGSGQSVALEIAVFGGLIFASCASAVPRVRHEFAVACALSYIPVMPVIMMGLANVGLNVFSLTLDVFHVGANLGWRALLSASLITGISMIAALAGSITGRLLALRKGRRSLAGF